MDAGPAGSEALKNLVLGGIASFTIVDGAKVESKDLGNNFLLEPACLGASRAEAVTGLLQELNADVAGSFVEDEPAALLATKPAFFRNFDVVIATQVLCPERRAAGPRLLCCGWACLKCIALQLRELDMLKLEEATRALGVALLLVRSFGLLGYLRVWASAYLP